MDRRRYRRVTALQPVRIWGVDGEGLPFSQVARAKNVSVNGAVLQGMLHTMKAGELLHLQLGQHQAEFSVVWVGRLGTCRQGEVGVQINPSEPNIWDVNLLRCSEFVGKG
jgi:hypothetical protein